MAMEKQQKLVKRLLERTRMRELEWKESVDGESFLVSFKDNSVGIRKLEKKSSIDYEIALFNDEGRVVDTFTDPELDATSLNPDDHQWYGIMKDLHEIARRTALGSEKVLDEILDEIDDVQF
jgi:hypothetical protein